MTLAGRVLRATTHIAVVLISLNVWGQSLGTNSGSIPALEQFLWPGGAPGAIGNEPADRPKLDVYALPPRHDGAPRPAFLVFPGGAYVALAKDHEGQQIAAWLNQRGITAFVLTYRLAPRYHYPAQLQDGSRAVRWVRANAAKFGIDPHRIGVWGFSAGGHLASLVGTHFDSGDPASPDPIERVSSRPDLLVLAYPVIEPLGQAAAFSYESLLGKQPDPAALAVAETDRNVTSATPPTFLFHTDDDNAVSSLNSVLFYQALKKSGVPAELHIYRSGPHGVGLAQSNPNLRTWPDRLQDWLAANNFIGAETEQGKSTQ